MAFRSSGTGTAPMSNACNRASSGEGAPSRRYSGGLVRKNVGRSATTAAPSRTTRWPSPVTRPMSAECSPQRSKSRWMRRSAPGRTITTMALLALGEHDLIRSHAGLAPGHLRDVQLDARRCSGMLPRPTSWSARRRRGPGCRPRPGPGPLPSRPRSAAFPGMGCRPARRRDAMLRGLPPRQRWRRECRRVRYPHPP